MALPKSLDKNIKSEFQWGGQPADRFCYLRVATCCKTKLAMIDKKDKYVA